MYTMEIRDKWRHSRDEHQCLTTLPVLFKGLDPAAPGFSVNDTETRLDPTDGDFVDIVHTNSGSLIQGGESMIEPIGHADFYPNGGQQQPGCLFTKSEEEVDFQEGKPEIC
jgi:hypothetical protein